MTSTITIQNSAGMPFNYAIFAEKPQINDVSGDQIFSCVIGTASSPPGATARFAVDQGYSALCGASRGPLADGVELSISQTQPVNLGQDTISMSAGRGMPYFVPERDPSSGLPGDGFGISTRPDFQVNDARNQGWFVGVGGSNRQAYAVFVPEPNRQYRIRPSNTYYVTFGRDFEAGTIINKERLSSVLQIDVAPRSSVNLVHEGDGTLRRR